MIQSPDERTKLPKLVRGGGDWFILLGTAMNFFHCAHCSKNNREVWSKLIIEKKEAPAESRAAHLSLQRDFANCSEVIIFAYSGSIFIMAS